MPQLDEMYQQLLEMPRREYSELIKKVDHDRRKAFERQEAKNPVRPEMTRDEFAHWVGRRHFFVDKGISKVFFLPTNSSSDEVRLLEVNDLALIPEAAPIEAVDFTPDIDGIHFSLYVADVGPRQLDTIRRGEIALPEGWSFESHQEITPTDS